jgi:hypothetical protein
MDDTDMESIPITVPMASKKRCSYRHFLFSRGRPGKNDCKTWFVSQASTPFNLHENGDCSQQTLQALVDTGTNTKEHEIGRRNASHGYIGNLEADADGNVKLHL